MIKLEERITVTVKDASELSGLGKTTLYSLMKEGKITGVSVGTRRLFHVSSLKALLNDPNLRAAAQGIEAQRDANQPCCNLKEMPQPENYHGPIIQCAICGSWAPSPDHRRTIAEEAETPR